MERTLTLQDGTLVEGPSWAKAQDILSRMDGVANSFVELNCGGPDSLWVSGGNEQRYLVIYMKDVDNQESLTLTDPSLSGGAATIRVEGVISDYPAPFCVGRTLMLDVARHFYENGAIPEALAWTDYQETLRSGQHKDADPGAGPRPA